MKQAEMAAQQTAVEQFCSRRSGPVPGKTLGTDEGEIPGLTSLCCVGGNPQTGC